MAEKSAKKWDPFKDGSIARDLKKDSAMINEIMFDKEKFQFLNLDERILRGLARAGFHKLSYIQKEAIPLGRIGVDMVLQARSGSGKTCAFTCIAYDSLVLPGDSAQVLVITPTREIAFQVSSVMRSIGTFYTDVKVCLCTGGFKVGRDVEEITGCQIIIGTPGRLIQLIELGHLKTSSIRLLIMDEADKLFENQLAVQIASLVSHLPESKQVIAVSATFNDSLEANINKYLNSPQIITTPADSKFPVRNCQFHCIIPGKANYNFKLTAMKKWIDNLQYNQIIIFVNTKESGQKISTDFRSNTSYNCSYVFGDLEQAERFEIFKKFHAHKFNILVTTDLFARGVDFKNVNMIINFDLPENKDTFLHRVGRAGRFGVDCLTLNLVEEGPEEELYKKLKDDLVFASHVMPDDLIHENPWGYLDARYKHIELKDYQRIDRSINHRRFRPPCRHWRPDPTQDFWDPDTDIPTPQKIRRVKPGREDIRRLPWEKKNGIYIQKGFYPGFDESRSDGREYLPENSGYSLRELYPPEYFEAPIEYYSSSEEEEDEMPPDGWPGCCGGHIVPGTNRWLSLDEDGQPIRHKFTVTRPPTEELASMNLSEKDLTP